MKRGDAKERESKENESTIAALAGRARDAITQARTWHDLAQAVNDRSAAALLILKGDQLGKNVFESATAKRRRVEIAILILEGQK